MALIDQTLFGPRDKVATAIERLKTFEPAEGYYLAFSGGKDSVVLYRLAEMADVKFDAHYHITNVDPPELVQFIKRSYPAVSRDRPPLSMWKLIVKNKFPPLRRIRYCCQELKEQGGDGRIVLTGVRWAESARRRRRQMTEQCLRGGNIAFVNPIIDWATSEIWEFIRKFDVPYCSLYDEGFTRLGCVLCPMSNNPQRDIDRWPRIAAQYLRTFDKVIAIRDAEGKPTKFKTGRELFDWWIRRNTHGQLQGQAVLFE